MKKAIMRPKQVLCVRLGHPTLQVTRETAKQVNDGAISIEGRQFTWKITLKHRRFDA
jgi:hypothetical protein